MRRLMGRFVIWFFIAEAVLNSPDPFLAGTIVFCAVWLGWQIGGVIIARRDPYPWRH